MKCLLNKQDLHVANRGTVARSIRARDRIAVYELRCPKLRSKQQRP